MTDDAFVDYYIHYRPFVVCILETKNQDGNFHRLFRKLCFPHYVFVCLAGHSSELLLLWSEDFAIVGISNSLNFINANGYFHSKLCRVMSV